MIYCYILIKNKASKDVLGKQSLSFMKHLLICKNSLNLSEFKIYHLR